MPLNLQLDAKGGRRSGDSGQLPISKFVRQLVEPISGSLTRLLLRYVIFDDLTLLSKVHLPCLEQLVLCLEDCVYQGLKNVGLSFVNTPALRRVSFSGSLDAGTDRSITFPWNQLTHFLCYNTLEYCEFFLVTYPPFCTQLRFLFLELHDSEIEESYIHEFVLSASTKIVLPNLEVFGLDFSNLSLDFDPPAAPYPYLIPFELPNLRKLLLTLSSVEATITSTFLDEIRNLKKLEHLSIEVQEGDTTTSLQPMLRASRHIKTLELSLWTEYTGFFEKLMEEDLVPNLQTLGIMFDPDKKPYNGPFLDFGIFRRFLEPRTRHGLADPLKKLIFFVRGDKTDYPALSMDAVREVLPSFISTGLVVEIKDSDLPNPSWISFDQELDGRAELLDIY